MASVRPSACEARIPTSRSSDASARKSLCNGTDSSPFDSEVPTLGRNDVYTHKSNLTIPGGYADGDHYLGVVLDRANAIVEFNSRNNTSGIPIKIDGMISISVDKGRPVGL